MALSGPTNDPIHNELKAFTDRSEQQTLVLAETSPTHRFIRVRTIQFSLQLRQSATQTVFIGLDTVSEERVCWHLLTLASFPEDVRQRVWSQLTLLQSLCLPITPSVLGLWQVPRRQQVVLVTPFTPSYSIDEYVEKTQVAPRTVISWLESILQLIESCKSSKLSPLHFSLENVRVTNSGSLLIEDLVHLPDPRDGRYLREFLYPSSSCDAAALGHFVLRLREVLPSDSRCCDRLTTFAMTCFRHLHEDHVTSMMRSSLQTSPSHIHLIIDWDGRREGIDFDFDSELDSIDEVVSEFIQEFNLSPDSAPALSQVIERKVRNTGKVTTWLNKQPLEVDLLTLSPAVHTTIPHYSTDKSLSVIAPHPSNTLITSIRKELISTETVKP